MNGILRKQNALKLNKEEIDELLEVLQHSLDRFPRQGIVFAGTE